jgi:hypothetical protein
MDVKYRSSGYSFIMQIVNEVGHSSLSVLAPVRRTPPDTKAAVGV